MAHMMQAMVDRGLGVCFILDSCHSGGATRGEGGATTRGIHGSPTGVDTTPRPTHSLVAPPDQLAQTWRSQSAGGTRDFKTGSAWLLEPSGYTLLAACRA